MGQRNKGRHQGQTQKGQNRRPKLERILPPQNEMSAPNLKEKWGNKSGRSKILRHQRKIQKGQKITPKWKGKQPPQN